MQKIKEIGYSDKKGFRKHDMRELEYMQFMELLVKTCISYKRRWALGRHDPRIHVYTFEPD